MSGTTDAREARTDPQRPVVADPQPQIGDWVQDWSGDLLRWNERHARRLQRHPTIAQYISQIRRADGTVWVRPGRSPITGAPLKVKGESRD